MFIYDVPFRLLRNTGMIWLIQNEFIQIIIQTTFESVQTSHNISSYFLSITIFDDSFLMRTFFSK